MFDLVIAGAHVYPGDGPPVRADVAVADGLIAAVGRDDGWSARERIDGRGLLLAPGFIDLHAHSALRPFSDPLLAAKTAQGFTTELIGPDGLPPAPISPDAWTEQLAYIAPIEGPGPERPAWGTIAEYLEALQGAGPATNLVGTVGHNAVRAHVMGRADRPPTPDELARLRHEVRIGFEAGCRALTFGLIYQPGMFATTDELVAIAEEAARYGAPLHPHIRNEGAGVLEAVGEMVEVARRSGAPLHITHLKLVGSPELLDPLLELIDRAARDVDLTFDQYPYGAGSTTLVALLPRWAQDGGREAILGRLADPGTRRRIVGELATGAPGWENLYATCGPENVFVVDLPASHAGLIGRSIAAIADERRADPREVVLDLLAETALMTTMIDHYATEAVVRRIFTHPLALVGSDAIFGPHPHPRLYGTAARVLGRYAIREGLIGVTEAIARLTARAADRLALADRGRIRVGLRADLVLLDPKAFVDEGTYEDPKREPAGVAAVFVGGSAVQRDGKATGARPGTVVRTPGVVPAS